MGRLRDILFLVCAIITFVEVSLATRDPKVRAFPYNTPNINSGLPIPKPQIWIVTENVFVVRNTGFEFNATGVLCDDLEAAFDRYYKIMFEVPEARSYGNKFSIHEQLLDDPDEITGLEVNVQQDCSGKPLPSLQMNELYKLTVSAGSAVLTADTLWGALRGLETFSQIVYETVYESHSMWLVNETTIEDFPRFAHRGVLIDTSRHFVENNIILNFVSAMAMAKFNVLHWHIVDNPSFPYRSRVFPQLSNKGSYEPYTHTYDHEDIAEIVEFARQRGIRVIAEFDTPGHTESWGPGQPGLLTPCYGKDGKPDGTFGPIDPTKNSTYDFLIELFQEVASVFPDKYIHLGGDEVDFSCWESNPAIASFMAEIGIAGDYAALESLYIQRLINLVEIVGNNHLVWQEPFDNGVQLTSGTIVNVWKTNPPPQKEIADITESGYMAITSACWYLNKIQYGEDWQQYYQCDPQDFNGTDQQKQFVIGGEACMWGEWVDGTNLMSRTWPRAAVVAERLWSSQNTTDLDSIKERLEEHRCRMIMRGLDADPIDPSYCRYEKQSEPPRF